MNPTASVSMDGSVTKTVQEPNSRTHGRTTSPVSESMEYFLESRNLDRATEQLLVHYANRDGRYCKNKVAAIVIDLREAVRTGEVLNDYNRLMKRLLCWAIVFSIFILSVTGALSYSVSRLTRLADVQADGTFLVKGKRTVIATDNHASTHDVHKDGSGKFCVLNHEVERIAMEVRAGKTVLMDVFDDDAGTEVVDQLKASGSTFNSTANCYWSEGKQSHLCFTPADKPCVPKGGSGRRLHEAFVQTVGGPGRRLNGRRLEGECDLYDSNTYCFQDCYENYGISCYYYEAF